MGVDDLSRLQMKLLRVESKDAGDSDLDRLSLRSLKIL